MEHILLQKSSIKTRPIGVVNAARRTYFMRSRVKAIQPQIEKYIQCLNNRKYEDFIQVLHEPYINKVVFLEGLLKHIYYIDERQVLTKLKKNACFRECLKQRLLCMRFAIYTYSL